MIDGAIAGEAIGWLKLSRVKKLLEDENYRNFAITRLNENNKQALDDHHIQDVVGLSSSFRCGDPCYFSLFCEGADQGAVEGIPEAPANLYSWIGEDLPELGSWWDGIGLSDIGDRLYSLL